MSSELIDKGLVGDRLASREQERVNCIGNDWVDGNEWTKAGQQVGVEWIKVD